METVNILCMKWGVKYGPEYVNTLYSMVKRHLTLPFRFICLTDNSDGFSEGIESFPIPKLDIPNGPERGWDKLTSFVSPFYDIQGKVLFLDLDVVIVDNIDCFFSHDAQFPIINDWAIDGVVGNSSVYRFESGAHANILDNFRKHHETIRKQHRNEQAYLSHFVHDQGKLSYWPTTWCQSFKYHCTQKNYIKQWLKAPELPEGTKIVIFHGNPNPPDAIEGRSGKWYRKVLPTPWVKEHWR